MEIKKNNTDKKTTLSRDDFVSQALPTAKAAKTKGTLVSKLKTQQINFRLSSKHLELLQALSEQHAGGNKALFFSGLLEAFSKLPLRKQEEILEKV